MKAPVLTESALQYAYEANHCLLTAQWEGAVPAAELPGQYAHLLEVARQHDNCRYWLLDVRGRQGQAAEADTWFAHGFAAELQSLGHPVFLAYVLDPSHYALASSADVAATKRACAKYDVYPYFFSNEADARAWLLHQQHLDHVPSACHTPRRAR